MALGTAWWRGEAIRRVLSRTLLTATAAALLVTGVAAGGSQRTYSGHTSQRDRVRLTVLSSGALEFSISFRARCSHTAPFTRPTESGSFHFNPAIFRVVRADHHGYFELHVEGPVTNTAALVYWEEGDTLSGRISGKMASGSFRFLAQLYTSYGGYLGYCDTGTVHWSAR
jgi:hypothetical protein